MKKLLIVFSVLLLLSSCGGKQDNNDSDVVDVKETIINQESDKEITHIDVDKKESVYASADAYGSVYKTEVEVILKATDDKTIDDYTDLKNIRNTNSDETFTIDGNLISFENKGEDIHYKGISDKNLPVDIKISYRLDGKNVTVEQLKGQSGKVEIRFDYSNNTKRIVNGMELVDPFMALTVVMLDDSFNNIEVENGKIIEYGDSKAVILYSLPGIEDSLKLNNYELTKELELDDYAYLTADVSDFSLAYTATILSNNLFTDIEDKDLNDIYEFVNDTKDFESDAKELTDNTKKLYDASVELRDNLKKYTAGVESLVSQLGTTGAVLSADAAKLQTDLESMYQLPQIQQLIADKTTIATKIAEHVNADSTLSDEEKKEKIQEYTKEYTDYLAELDKDYTVEKTLTVLSDEITTLVADYKNSNNLKLMNKLSSLATDLTKMASDFSGISSSSSSGNITSANKAINDGLDTLVDAAKEFDDGMNDFVNDDLDDLMKLGGSSLKTVADRIKALRTLDQEYGCFSGLLEDKKGETIFVIETDEIK